MDKSPEAFRTISEVAEALETPAHVLRFWESRFPQIRPVKRAGGRRYYRPADVALLTGIKRLLHDEGMTIRGVQKILREQGIRHVSGLPDEISPEEEALEAAMAGRFDSEPGLAPELVEEETVAALEAALDPRGVVLPFAPPSSDPEDDILLAPEVEAGSAEIIAEADADWQQPLVEPAPEGFDDSTLFDGGAGDEGSLPADESADVEPLPEEPPAKVAVAAPPVAAEPAPPPAPADADIATLAARLRALPRGSLAAKAEPLAGIAVRITSLRDRLAGQPPRP